MIKTKQKGLMMLLLVLSCIMLALGMVFIGASATTHHSAGNLSAHEVSSIDSSTQVAIDNVVYQIDDTSNKTAMVYGYQSGITTANIASQVTINGENYTVTSIGDYAFQDCAGLTSITIPSSVTSINSYAFGSCTGLTSITIPDSVTSIGQDAFYGCRFTNVSIGTGLAKEYVRYILGSDGKLTIKSMTNSPAWKTANVNPLITSVEWASGVSFTSIGDFAFSNCSSLTSITIPNGITSIGGYAFSGCTELTSITIPDNVTRIGSFAFGSCTGLTSITIPNSVTNIGSNAFGSCRFTNVSIGTGLAKEYDTYILGSDGKLTIKSMTDSPAWYTANVNPLITSVEWASGVSFTSIGDYAFQYCRALASITIPNGVTSINSYAFCGCTSLTSITIPSSVTSVGDHAFQECTGLTSITIPDSVTSIGSGAFLVCTGLTSITIQDGVASINSYAFQDCTGLTSITIPDSVTSIGERAFFGCTGLTSVTIPDNVTSIGREAFGVCTGLTSITIQDGVTSVGDSAFASCTGLTSITIPDSVTSIGGSAFSGCTGLTSITIQDGVTSIGEGAFASCTGLTSITIPDSVTGIGSGAFFWCSSLEVVDMDGCKLDFGDYVFEGCPIKAIYLPESVNSFGAGALSTVEVASDAMLIISDMAQTTPKIKIFADGTFVDLEQSNATGTWTRTESADFPGKYDYVLTYENGSTKTLTYEYQGQDVYNSGSYSTIMVCYDLQSAADPTIKGRTLEAFASLYDEVEENGNTVYVLKDSAKNVNGKALVYLDDGEMTVREAVALFGGANVEPPATGVALDISLIAISIVLLGALFVVAGKKGSRINL